MVMEVIAPSQGGTSDHDIDRIPWLANDVLSALEERQKKLFGLSLLGLELGLPVLHMIEKRTGEPSSACHEGGVHIFDRACAIKPAEEIRTAPSLGAFGGQHGHGHAPDKPDHYP